MPLTSRETKAALIEQINQLLNTRPDSDIEDALDAQVVKATVTSYATIEIKVLPCNSGAWRYFTLKISEQQ